MKINILTIFPEMFRPLRESMLGRAEENGIIEFNIVDVREFSLDKHKKTDDYPFGGGQGMVFMPQSAFDALKSIGADKTRNIYMSPRGRVLDMELALELADYLCGDVAASGGAASKSAAAAGDITIFCGHYEGIDQRIIDYWKMEEVSIGDYILTGGELAAMVLIDAVARLIPGVLGEEHSALDESIYSGLLEYPQYTQPRTFAPWQNASKNAVLDDISGDEAILGVPEILLSGNHKEIGLWRFRESIRVTKQRRPDILKAFLKNHREKHNREFTRDEIAILIEELDKKDFDIFKKHLSDKEAKSLEKILEKNRKKLL
ncbi:MAG: tRNA (guanosine(37)-N1)-methyltransferase TrmD [Firmicutes bacterium]|nr:tRNA (guanosine(37)-N1)-methyltransferase TrmD [Bacillota bacterium]